MAMALDASPGCFLFWGLLIATATTDQESNSEFHPVSPCPQFGTPHKGRITMNLVSKASYSLEEQMEIAGADTTPVSPKVERVNGFLNQGRISQ